MSVLLLKNLFLKWTKFILSETNSSSVLKGVMFSADNDNNFLKS